MKKRIRKILQESYSPEWYKDTKSMSEDELDEWLYQLENSPFFVNDPMIVYHVTDNATYHNHIIEQGLTPQRGQRASAMGDPKGIYFFKSYEDAINSIHYWMKSEFQLLGVKELVVLRVDISGIEYKPIWDYEGGENLSGMLSIYVEKPISKDRVRMLKTVRI